MYQQTAICCTLNSVPMTASALQKSRLPFGIHLYPFATEDNIPVLSEGPIVRCATCRAYINPYVRMKDLRSWHCNLCNRLNELPVQFVYDYANQRYYELGTKLELNSETVEYVATVDYTVRAPQPACYLFVFDCSRAATELGYISVMATAIADLFDQIPGDARALIGFIAYDSNVHYFSFCGSQVVHHASPDVTADTVPCSTDGLLVNMNSKREMILDFLTQTLPTFPFDSAPTTTTTTSNNMVTETRSALGAALRAAISIIKPIGGRISIVLGQLPNYGSPSDGSVLSRRDDPNSKKSAVHDKNAEYLTPLINPATDCYKNLALECSEHQVSVDLFNLATTYVDLASISPLAKFTAGTLFHYSNAQSQRATSLLRFDQDFRNQLVRPTGLEAVLRLRYSRGLKIHTFHGNFFVRSPNLLVLPNANPDASFAFQIAIEDDLKPDTRFVYFQASLLYTTPAGERRIRIHTARYPTVTTLPEIIYNANQTAIVALLAKMAVDRSMQKSIGEAREALIGAGVDLLEIYSIADEMRAKSYPMGLPENLRLVPLYILALLKHNAIRVSSSIGLDERVAALERFKTLAVDDLVTYIYPDLFPLHNIASDANEDWKIPIQLTAAHIDRNGAYLLDAYDTVIIYICESIDPRWCYDVFGVSDYSQILDHQDVFAFDTNYNHNQAYHPALHSSSSSTSAHTGAPGTGSISLQQINQLLSPPNASNQLSVAASVSQTPLVKLPELESFTSTKLRDFISCMLDSRPQKPKFYILKEHSPARTMFTQYLVDDRSENSHSYAEFWKFLKDQVVK